jgi:Lar family restriction alleviation protein
MEKPLKCPFCDSEDIIQGVTTFGQGSLGKTVKCNNCQVEMPDDYSGKSAIKKWNQRVCDDVVAENQALKIIEIRIISHTPNPMGYRVALIFDNGQTSPCTKDFPTYEAAQFFIDGLRDGLQWQAMLIEAGIASAARFQEENAMQPLDAEDFIAMIERDYLRKEITHQMK